METFEKAAPVELTPHDIRDVDTVWAAARQQYLEKEARAKVAQTFQSNAQKLQSDAQKLQLHDELMSTTAGGGGDDDDDDAKSEDSIQGGGLGKSNWAPDQGSSSRPSSCRSSGRKRAKRAGTQKKLEQWVREGKLTTATWQTRVDDDADPMARERAASRMMWCSKDVPEQAAHCPSKDIVLDDTTFELLPSSSAAVDQLLSLAAANKLTTAQLVHRSSFSPEGLIAKVSQDEINFTARRMVSTSWCITCEKATEKPCEDSRHCVRHMYCPYCKKEASEAHVASKAHQTIAAEIAFCNRAVGPTPSLRRHGKGCRPPVGGVLTQQMVCEYWGDVRVLPEIARATLKKAGYLLVKSSPSARTQKVPFSKITGMQLGMVSYNPADSKYKESVFVPFAMLPETDKHTFGEDHDPTLKKQLKEDQSWWPVIQFQFAPEFAHLTPDWEETVMMNGVPVRMCVCVVWLGCYYQILCWVEVAGWPIRVIRPRL
jgi:hypothetical protein